jgi:hypothetical protein
MSADLIKEAFEIVTSMENDLEDARVLADGVAILAVDAIHDNEKLGAVFLRLAWQIAGGETIARRSKKDAASFLNWLHPDRDHFEKEGWPDEQDGPPLAG